MKSIKIIFTLLLLLVLTSSRSVELTSLSLIDSPLIINQSVRPALAVTFDDSGSMAWGFMPDTRSFHSFRRSYASSDYNLIYFNPELIYVPPVTANGSLPNSVFSSANIDGYGDVNTYTEYSRDTNDSINEDSNDDRIILTGNSTINLNSEYRMVRYIYPDYVGNTGFVRFSAAGNPNGNANSADTGISSKAYYYSWNGPGEPTRNGAAGTGAGEYTLNYVTAAQQQNFANWYTYYNTRGKLARAAVSLAFVKFGPDFKIDWQQLNNKKFPATGGTNMKVFADALDPVSTHRTDFYNWLLTVPANGGTPLRRAAERAGLLFEKGTGDSDTTSPYYDDDYGAELTCQQNFHIAVSDGTWNGGAAVTGNPDSLVTTLPDGTVYNPNTLPSSLYSGTSLDGESLADVAFSFWSRDLRPNLANDVPTFLEGYNDSSGEKVEIPENIEWSDMPELFWNPKNDPANWQHVVNFNVGLGISGSLDQNSDLPFLRNGTKTWPETRNICYSGNGNIGNGNNITACRSERCRRSSNNSTSSSNCNRNTSALNRCQYYNGDNWVTFTCSNRIRSRYNPSLARVDDVWHSSVNSRGKYFSAKDPLELSQTLNKVVSNILARKGRASAGSVSSSILSNVLTSFKTSFDTANWSGTVTGTSVDSVTGKLGVVLWDAGCKLTGGSCASLGGTNVAERTNEREIITYFNDTQYNFKLGTGGLPPLALTDIKKSDFIENLPVTVTDADIVNYIRGNRSKELREGGPFRNRQSLLGDVIHSPAVIVRGPSSGFKDDKWVTGTIESNAVIAGKGYEKFREDNLSRDNMLLVGANDGMLHAFSAGIGVDSVTKKVVKNDTGGDEYWAYLPSKSLVGLSVLTDPDYVHRSFVDAAPTVQDAYIDGGWKTVALGGMRFGGKLFYALNMGADTKAVPKVQWEFTDSDDADMGYSYSGGIIAMVRKANSTETKWVAFVPNGYNSSNQKSVMYAIDLETGILLHKFSTNVLDTADTLLNGMGPLTAGDFLEPEGSGIIRGSDQSADFIYGGDLAGNVYKFDTQKVFTAGGSEAQTIFKGSRLQPITTAPRIVSKNNRKNDDVTIIFGTGKFIEPTDRDTTLTPPQYVVGIRDKKDSYSVYNTLNDTRFVAQRVTNPNSTDFRKISTDEVTDAKSWKLELPTSGERIINLIGRDEQSDLLLVLSTIPSGDNPCVPGGRSWIMVIDAISGASLVENFGGFFNNAQSDGKIIDDIVLGFNLLHSPGGNSDILSIDVASGTGSTNLEIKVSSKRWGRKSWHRILLD